MAASLLGKWMVRKLLDSDEALVDVLDNHSEIVIYGAGNYGHTLKAYVKLYFDKELPYFAVSREDLIKERTGEYTKAISVYPRDRLIIVAVSEQHQVELIETVEKLGFYNIYFLLNDFVRYMQARLDTGRLSVKDKLGFEVHIAEHCNLNCKGCYHFSPLAEEIFLDLGEYARDITRIHDICGVNVERITLLGGEPLLHPRISEITTFTRKYNPYARIEILTNGILLKDMEQSFWKNCVTNDITICCTKYPILVDYNQLEKIADGYGLKIVYHNDVGAGEKTLIKYPFDVLGTQDPEESFFKCTRSNLCITLKHGKLYPCPMAAHAHLAKEFFDLDLELSDKDFIDIYKVKSMNEIMSFFIKPINFCKYCNLKRRPQQMKWEASKKEYGEWF